MVADNRVVYITGVTGIIGRVLAESFAREYVLRGNDRRDGDVPGVEVAKGDVADPVFMREQLRGAHTVIHLAGNPSRGADWETVLHGNILGTREVFEAARLAGAQRVVFASTNHVTGILTERDEPMDGNTAPRPDSLYGVSKAFGEVLGRYYADRHGLSVLCYRIGYILKERDERKIVAKFSSHWNHGRLMWLSASDCVEAFRRGIEADPRLKYGVYYIMSNNRGRLWDLSNARAEIGFNPKDDLSVLFERCGVSYDFPTVQRQSSECRSSTCG